MDFTLISEGLLHNDESYGDAITLKVRLHSLTISENSKYLRYPNFITVENINKAQQIQVNFNDYTMWFGFLTYKDFEFCMQKYRGHKLQQTTLQILKYTENSTGKTFEKPEFTLNSKNKKATEAIELYVEDLRRILYNFVDEDKDTLDEILEILEDYSLQPIDVICQDELCKNEYTVNINDEDVLVLPFRDSKKYTGARIVLSKDNIDKSDNNETNESEGSGNSSGITSEASKE